MEKVKTDLQGIKENIYKLWQFDGLIKYDDARRAIGDNALSQLSTMGLLIKNSEDYALNHRNRILVDILQKFLIAEESGWPDLANPGYPKDVEEEAKHVIGTDLYTWYPDKSYYINESYKRVVKPSEIDDKKYVGKVV